MLMQTLKDEYELRYRFVQWQKYYKQYLYNKFEKNNCNLIIATAEYMKASQC